MATAQVWIVAFCLVLSVVPAVLPARPACAADWDQVQKIKLHCLTLAAQHAMEQQKATQAPAVPIAFPQEVTTRGTLKVTERFSGSMALDVLATPQKYGVDASEAFAFKLPMRMDLVSKLSGLAFTIQTQDGSSPEVRLGCRLFNADREDVEIAPVIPVVSAWGENPREVYLDWSFLNYDDVDAAVRILKSVDVIEFTFSASLRAPARGPAEAARPATLTISNLRAVDYLKGSYDPSRQGLRFDEKQNQWVPTDAKDLTLQHRCQEVTGIVALYGGKPGVASAIDSLDMAARTQCWDGSFLDGRRGPVTVASGEYTFGFTLYGLLCGYQVLEKAEAPGLSEKITIGPLTLPRRDFYQRMFYRGAMARAASAPADYRDDIIGGNTLITGANRVLGYAIAMRMIADALTDEKLRRNVLGAYGPIMQQIADAQGQFSGGFPLLGEGDRFGGQGIHYDAGYVRTHMDWLVVGAKRTGDPAHQDARAVPDGPQGRDGRPGHRHHAHDLRTPPGRRERPTHPARRHVPGGAQVSPAHHRPVGLQLRHPRLAELGGAAGEPLHLREPRARLRAGGPRQHPCRRHGPRARPEEPGLPLPAAIPDLVDELPYQGWQTDPREPGLHLPRRPHHQRLPHRGRRVPRHRGRAGDDQEPAGRGHGPGREARRLAGSAAGGRSR
jgi:hypothetical protein